MHPAAAVEYSEAMQEGASFPPVVVFHDGETYWLADGFHRVEAARMAGFDSIQAEIRHGSKRDARLHAVGANQAHGLRRSNADKRRAVMAILEDPEWNAWSDREVAARCGVTHPFVAKLRGAEVVTVTTPMNRAEKWLHENARGEMLSNPHWLPESGYGATGQADVNGIRWTAFLMPQSYEEASEIDGDAYLWLMVMKDDPTGEAEVMGLRKPIMRSLIEWSLKEFEFPIEAATWAQHSVSNEPDDEDLPFDRRWSWPHLFYASKAEWIKKRWAA